MKKASGASADFDRDKLKAYTTDKLDYRYGAFIPFTTGLRGTFGEIEWFGSPN